ncbi:MAG: heavy-metal-associated domain-containing protein [Ignavibacteriales bacterium]|nr:heavy-metal-associated domain-containing protein [Ignavibacteriales bacterium]
MKQIFSFIVIAVLAISVLSAQTKPKAETTKTAAKVETAIVKVPTVVCGMCVSTITKALKTVEGVKSTKIDLKKKTATVTYASTKVSLSQIEKAISNAGYDANNIKRDPAAYEKLDACCKTDTKE